MNKGDGPIIAVTGAAGFLGRNLIPALVARGYRVRALVRDEANGAAEGAFETMTVDLMEKGVAEKALEGAYGLFHLAGIVGKLGVLENEYWQVHVTSTRRLLEAARTGGLRRFIYCSSASIMGNIKNPPADEAAPLGLRDVYDITKAHGEVTALAGGGKGHLEVTVVRPAAVYGPGDLRRLWFFRSIASGRFTLIGDGGNLIHPVYIDDVTDGMIKAFESPLAAGKIYILGGERYLKLREWIELIAAQANVAQSFIKIPGQPARAAAWLCEKGFNMFGLEPPIYRRYTDFFLKNRAYDISLAARELEHTPRVGLEEGARRTWLWYSQRNLI